MNRVVITGMGVVSSIATDLQAYWENLIKGVNGITEITSIPHDDIPVHFAGEVKDFDPLLNGVPKDMARRNDRFAQFALSAASKAVADSGIVSGENIEPERFGVYIGSGIGGLHTLEKEHSKLLEEGSARVSPLFIPMMISNIAAGNVAIIHNAQGPCLPTVTACATSSHAIGEAFRAIRYGYADAIISGGAEAAISPLAIGGFFTSKALSRAEKADEVSLPFDKRRQGFTMGEGAGVVVLEEYEHAVKRGAKIYAEVCGYGNTCDAHHITAPRPDGACAQRAITLALQEAGYQSGERLYVNAHGTGTPLNDKSETVAIKNALGEAEARKAYISSIKSMIGHCLGAAGGLELVATALTLKNGIIPPTINLNEPDPDCDLNYVPNVAIEEQCVIAISENFGFGGQNACLALRKV